MGSDGHCVRFLFQPMWRLAPTITVAILAQGTSHGPMRSRRPFLIVFLCSHRGFMCVLMSDTQQQHAEHHVLLRIACFFFRNCIPGARRIEQNDSSQNAGSAGPGNPGKTAISGNVCDGVPEHFRKSRASRVTEPLCHRTRKRGGNEAKLNQQARAKCRTCPAAAVWLKQRCFVTP